VVPELVEEGFVEEVLDIFCVVEGGGGRGRFRCFFLVSWFTGIYALLSCQTRVDGLKLEMNL